MRILYARRELYACRREPLREFIMGAAIKISVFGRVHHKFDRYDSYI